MLNIMLTRQSIFLLVTKIVTTTLTCESSASCWTYLFMDRTVRS